MSADHLFVLGANHHRAPMEVRERLSLDAAATEAIRGEIAAIAGIRELAVVSTCNRVEFYGVGAGPETVAEVQTRFCTRQKFSQKEFESFRLSLGGAEAVRHLLEVAAGLDSQMVGETEILGQVKDAYSDAQARGHTGAVLNRVFQKAFQAAKHVRTDTAISEGQVSVANVAVDLALNIFGHLGETRLCLVGAGEIGEKTATAFHSRGTGSITVANRGFERALELATELGASAMPYDQREARLGEFDIVVCATSAPDIILSRAAAAAAMHKRPARPLFFIDLAMPRDVDPAVAGLPNVYLYNLDDLAKIAEENRVARAAEIAKCQALIATRADALWRQVEPRLASSAGASHLADQQTESA